MTKCPSLPHTDGSVVFARMCKCTPPSNTCFRGPPKSTLQTTYRSVQPFLHSSRHTVHILYNGPPLPIQNCPFAREIWTPSNTWFIELTRVHKPNGISIGSAVFCGTDDRDRHAARRTDHATRSVAIGRLYVVLQCGLTTYYRCKCLCCCHRGKSVARDYSVHLMNGDSASDGRQRSHQTNSF